jgi:hypothetical protein
MNKIVVHAGAIFCIPLFMPKDDWKLKARLSDNDLDKDFAFRRVIETSSSVLVENFKKIGSAQTSISEIENSGVLFAPLQIFCDGIIKKRWHIIGKTDCYDKYKHSNYESLKMIFGVDGDFRLRNYASCQGKKAIWLSTTSALWATIYIRLCLKFWAETNLIAALSNW